MCLQYVAACCNVLPSVAVCCSTRLFSLQLALFVSFCVYYYVLQRITVRCSVLQRVAVGGFFELRWHCVS